MTWLTEPKPASRAEGAGVHGRDDTARADSFDTEYLGLSQCRARPGAQRGLNHPGHEICRWLDATTPRPDEPLVARFGWPKHPAADAANLLVNNIDLHAARVS